MTDHLSPEKRSWNMSRIQNKDTSLEKKVRSYLFTHGFRFRKNDARLSGKPDIVLPKYHTVVFVHGCFWHRHAGCKYSTTPSTNSEFWNKKFIRNVENDNKHYNELTALGWNVQTVWGCEIKHDFEKRMEQLILSIQGGANE